MRALAVLAVAVLLAGCSGSSESDGAEDSGPDASAGSTFQVRPVLGPADLECDDSGDPDLPGNAPAGEETSACDVDGAGLSLGPAGVDGGVAAAELLRSTDTWILQVTLDEDAAADLAAIGENAASSDSRIALVLDGIVLAAPTVAGTLGDTLQINGAWTGEQAERYAALLMP